MMLDILKRHNHRFLYGYALLGSLVMAGIILSWRQPFNSDGILYLYTAKIYQMQGLHAAMSAYSWPFFSILIAITATLTHLSILNAAYLLIICFDTLTIIMALALVRALGFNRRQQQVLLLLFIIFPWFNHFRSHILRGHGYYAAALCSLLLLIYHIKRPRVLTALGFSVMAIVAMLFRIEGVLILLFAPLVLLLDRQHTIGQRLWALGGCYWLPGLAVVIALIHLSVEGHWLFNPIRQVQIDIMQPLQHPLKQFLVARDQLAAVLPFHSRHDSNWLLGVGLIVLLLRQILLVLGTVYVVLAVCACFERPLIPNRQGCGALWGYMAILLMIGASFVFQNLFLSDRYIALFVILTVLLLPQGWLRLYRFSHTLSPVWRYSLRGVCFGVLLVNLIASVWYFGPSKAYIVEAGKWMKHTLPSTARIYLQDSQLAYYTGRAALGIRLREQGEGHLTPDQQSKKFAPYDYIAVDFSRKQHDQMRAWQARFGQPIKIFGGIHDGWVAVFSVQGARISKNGD